MIGRTLKHFVIEQPLGQGGMGVVYRARDTKLQRPVALKVLAKEITADAEKKKRLLLEARAAARISHPAIAQVYDVDEVDGIIFIAMELVEGKNVAELIRHKELDLLGSIDIAIQVGEGLAKAHEAGIVHRDIKPANVILSKDGHVKILDFGLAKLLDAKPATAENLAAPTDLSTLTVTQTGAVMGTAAYMSPEQVRGGAIDTTSDLFSLGVMIFEMATWESPFRRPSLMETMHAVAFDNTPSVHAVRPNLPMDLQRIVTRCLRKRPEDRYPNAMALVHDLKLLRRAAESGWAPAPVFRIRLEEALAWLRRLTPRDYAWMVAGLAALALVVYLRVTKFSLVDMVFPVMAALFLYRYIKNRPQQLLDFLVRKVSRIPEVRLVIAHQNNLTVVVDQPVAQLYRRIQQHTSAYNQKLFFGQPMSAVIRHDLSPEECRALLNGPGVQYVRDDHPPEK